jgi:serine/threonine protein kinase
MPYRIGEELRGNATLKTLQGEPVNVLKVISKEGGQGDVYRVNWKGGEYALKWYNRTEADAIGSEQYRNIKRLTGIPNPDPKRFIWPQVIVTEDGSEREGALFGYLMDLIPDGYHELKKFLCSDSNPGQKKFKSFHAMIWSALHMMTAVRALHLQGMSYKDLNPGNVSIDPATGRSLMVDCDNISVDGDPCTVSGMRGYMAPEIVRSGFRKTPDIQTDLFSEAIILFRLFYMDHPMEGRRWNEFPVHTDRVEDELYSYHPIYNMAREDDRNRPDEVWAPNVIPRMERLPRVLLQGFENTFVNGIEHIMGRTTDNAWLSYLTAARDQMVFLDPKCEREQCVYFQKKETIPPGCLRLTVGQKRSEVALYPMQSLFKNTLTGNHQDYETRVGWLNVVRGVLAMQNLSGQEWEVYDPTSKKVMPVAHQQWFPVKAGTQIKFSGQPKIVGVIDDPRR